MSATPLPHVFLAAERRAYQIQRHQSQNFVAANRLSKTQMHVHFLLVQKRDNSRDLPLLKANLTARVKRNNYFPRHIGLELVEPPP